jgi:hypothetical protein
MNFAVVAGEPQETSIENETFIPTTILLSSPTKSFSSLDKAYDFTR